jgi:hypothetical protein
MLGLMLMILILLLLISLGRSIELDGCLLLGKKASEIDELQSSYLF